MDSREKSGVQRSPGNSKHRDFTKSWVTTNAQPARLQNQAARSKSITRSSDLGKREASFSSPSAQTRHSSLQHPFGPTSSVTSEVLSTGTSVIPDALRDLAGDSSLGSDFDANIKRILGLDSEDKEYVGSSSILSQDDFFMNPMTLRFINPQNEREYLEKLATRQLRTFRLGISVGCFVWLISGVYHYLIGYYFVSYLNAFAFIFSLVCVTILNKEKFATRNFIKVHMAAHFAYIIVAIVGRYPQYLEGPAFVTFIVNYIFLVVIRSTYLESVLMSSISVLFLISFSFIFSDAIHVFCFSISTLYLSVTALYMFREMEMKNRRIFVMNTKIRDRRAIRFKEQRYFEKMLFNLYPEPVARDVLAKGLVNGHFYSSENAFALIVQLFKDEEGEVVQMSRARRKQASEEIHGYGVALDAVTIIMEKYKFHRVKPTGLCIAGCLGLFDIVDSSSLAAFECAISITRFIEKEAFRVRNKKISCKVSISFGKIFGGVIEGEKQTFDIHGRAVASAWAGIELCPKNKIILSNCTIPQELLGPVSRVNHKGSNYCIIDDHLSLDVSPFEWSDMKDEDDYIPLTSIEEEMSLEKDLFTRTYFYFFHFYSFKEVEYEREYQQIICGISNALLARTDYTLYLIMFAITGLLDIYIYHDLGGDVKDDLFGFTILFRFFVIFPLVLAIQILFCLNNTRERIELFGTKLDQTLLICGFSLMGAHAFSKGFMVYDSHLAEGKDLNELINFFAEAYDFLGAIVSCSYIPYNLNMGVALFWYEVGAAAFLYWNAIFNMASWFVVCNWIGMFIFSAYFFFVQGMISKEYATRKEYLYRKYLVESLEEAELGREMVLKTLQSVVGKQMCSKIIAKKKSVVDLDETVTMCIIRLIPDENADMMIKEYYELFNLIFNIIENVSLTHKMEVIKIFGENILIWSRSTTGPINHLEKAVRFSFDASRVMSELYDQKRSKFNFRIGLCTLEIVAGIIGHRRFAYDIVTDNLIPKLFYLVDNGHLGSIQVDQESSLLMEEVSGTDVIAVPDTNTSGDGFRRYVQPMSNPWKLFASYIVWAHDDLEESPVPKLSTNKLPPPIEIIE